MLLDHLLIILQGIIYLENVLELCKYEKLKLNAKLCCLLNY